MVKSPAAHPRIFAGKVIAAAALGLSIGAAGFLYPTSSRSDNAQALQGLAIGAMEAFKPTIAPEPVAALEIVDGEGKPRPLDGWQGRVVLLNLWATWCAPCLEELPALDKLKAELGGPDFDLVALNIDKAPERARKFLTDAGIKSIEFLRDPTTKAFAAVKTHGMPTTLLIDRQGREIGRLVGPAKWDSPQAKALIQAAIAAR